MALDVSRAYDLKIYVLLPTPSAVSTAYGCGSSLFCSFCNHPIATDYTNQNLYYSIVCTYE